MRIACLFFLAFSLNFAATASAQARLEYFEYKLEQLDDDTRSAIDSYNLALSKYSEGCSEEKTAATTKLWTRIANDGVCGTAITATMHTAKISKNVQATAIAATTAAIVCGISVPQGVKSHLDAKDNLAMCESLESLLSKYDKNCKGKDQIVTAYKDVLYCFDNDKNQIVSLDLKNNILKVAKTGLATFKGFEKSRYQEHDDVITKIVADFNKNKKSYCDGTDKQAKKIPNLDPKLVKSWLIQESGGGDSGSLAAWKVDPAQVNVPGDWTKYKTDVGLTEPKKRNEGKLEDNIKAAVKFLVRKGFGKSAQPAKNRPSGFFDGWQTAIRRYNGRTVITTNGKAYSENYAKRIVDRANNKDTNHKIALPKPK